MCVRFHLPVEKRNRRFHSLLALGKRRGRCRSKPSLPSRGSRSNRLASAMMNIRKKHDYSALFAETDQAIRAGFSQMELYCALGKIICTRSEKGAAVVAAESLDSASEMCYNVRKTIHQSQSPRSGDFKLRMQFDKTQSGLLLCYTEQDEAIAIAFAANNRGRHLPFRLNDRYRHRKYPNFAPSIWQRHTGREPPVFKSCDPRMPCVWNTRNAKVARGGV